MINLAKKRAKGARSKARWRKRYPDKARRRNTLDVAAYYWRNHEKILEQRRIRYKRRRCADLLAKEKLLPESGYGYRGKLEVHRP